VTEHVQRSQDNKNPQDTPGLAHKRFQFWIRFASLGAGLVAADLYTALQRGFTTPALLAELRALSPSLALHTSLVGAVIALLFFVACLPLPQALWPKANKDESAFLIVYGSVVWIIGLIAGGILLHGG
jgi:hypothetical protein